MIGFALCFVVPGVLIGMLLGESLMFAKQKARAQKQRRAPVEKRGLFVYDLRSDLPVVRKAAA